ncbi:PQQ-binding-like beta-propeller repeat protein [candidate division KSB1 bacterium]|nr:PQQ-binding-like beta-propeller repeat protein [candidate division KSB1 bacterium]
MKTLALVLLAATVTTSSNTPTDYEKNWPQWRGPHANGVAAHANPPLEWSETKNIRWKIEVPGKGLSSPVVWGDRVFITTAVALEQSVAAEAGEGRRRGGIAPTSRHKFVLLALARRDGKVVWERTAIEAVPHEGTHNDGSWASNSAITDGEHVIAHFGSRGIFCYDMQGKLAWQKDLGDMSTRNGFGEGSSPALHGNTLVVNWDHEGESFIVALDKRSGKELWRNKREEITSWSTPLVVTHEGKTQVIVNATNRVRAYDLASGAVIWECGGMTVNVIPSPVTAEGVVYVTSGFRGSALRAIRLAGAKGDITDSPAVLWKYDQDTPYVPSPLLYGDKIYFLKVNSGILSCLNAKTGASHYGPQRLEGVPSIYASPVAAAERVYVTSRDGMTLVIKHGPAFEVLASNKLNDEVDASIAIVDREIFLRGGKFLYCIAEK